jgi:ABC-type glutathione transport system ATPase component
LPKRARIEARTAGASATGVVKSLWQRTNRDGPDQARSIAIEVETLLKLDGVTKVFYTDEVETHALEGVHLEIHKGEYVSIAGPSGCGKSTLLSILGLLDTPTDGDYQLNTQPVAKLTLGQRARIRNREVGSSSRAST